MSQSANQQCSICMMDFEETDSKVVLGCSHKFHYNCILRWNLQSSEDNHRSCPLCREDMHINDALQSVDNHLIENEAQNNNNNNNLFQTQNINSGIDYLGAIDGIQRHVSLQLNVSCSHCNKSLIPCQCCGTYICGCQYNIDNNYENMIHCPSNPFKPPINYDDIEDGEIVDVYCAKCFENRDELVLNFMINNNNEIYIFNHEKMQELYELFFHDTSRQNNDTIYTAYRSQTYQEFQERMSEIYSEEIINQNSADQIIDLRDQLDEEDYF